MWLYMVLQLGVSSIEASLNTEYNYKCSLTILKLVVMVTVAADRGLVQSGPDVSFYLKFAS